MIIWSAGFIQRKNGAVIYLLLCTILFFTGGGMAQIIGIIMTTIVAAQISSPLTGWVKAFSGRTGKTLAKSWPGFLTVGFFPGFRDPHLAFLHAACCVAQDLSHP